MRSVRYTKNNRSSHKRTLRSSDFVLLGIDGVDHDVTWSAENGFTVVMNNKVSDSLVEALPNEFAIVGEDEPDPVVLDPMTSLASSASLSPEESLDSSQDDENDDEGDSSADDDPDE